MAQSDNKTSLSPDEKRSLSESARLCEMIVEANPRDTGAAETWKRSGGRRGAGETRAGVAARRAGRGGGRPPAGVTPSAEPPPPVAAPAPPVREPEPPAPMESAGKRGG